MTLWLIIDNAQPVPHRLRELIGVERFGQLIYKRQTISSIMERAASAASLPPPVDMETVDDWAALAETVRHRERPTDRFLVCPAGIIAGRGPEAVIQFLKQARYSPQNLDLPLSGGANWSGWILLIEPLFRGYLAARAQNNVLPFLDENAHHFVRMDERLKLTNLREEVTLLEFLSGTFDARFFNSLERSDYTITKRSTDKAKLRQEYRFWEMLPAQMQMFFIRPFDFVEDDASASYKMERLFVPDIAVQWLHHAFSEVEFRRLIKHLLYFISIRPTRKASAKEVDAMADELYVTKVRKRLDTLKTLPEYAVLAPMFDRASGGIDALFNRYLALYARLRGELGGDRLVIGHGDLCFSNMLYAKTTQTLKLIDPRGAANETDLWTHSFYDLAKLSHSVIGSYDFVNHGMFDVQIDDAIRPQLTLDRQPPDWARPIFEESLAHAGYSVRATRLCEASLFISMLPLHIDRPRKVLAFVLVVMKILTELESA